MPIIFIKCVTFVGSWRWVPWTSVFYHIRLTPQCWVNHGFLCLLACLLSECLTLLTSIFRPPGASSFKALFMWHCLHDSSSRSLGWTDSYPLYTQHLCFTNKLLLLVYISLIVSRSLILFLFPFWYTVKYQQY